MARETYLATLGAALYAGRFAVGGGMREVAEAARWAPTAPQLARGPDLLLDGLALLITEGYAAGMPVLKRALQAFRSGHMSNAEGMRWLWLVCQVAIIGWDWETWRLFGARQVSLARDAGALVALPLALITLSTLLAGTGDFAAAAPLLEEAEEINEATRSQLHFQPYAALQIAAWQGDEATAMALIEGSAPRARRRGEGLALACIDWATAVLYNGLGRYEKALAAAEHASEHPQELWSTLLTRDEAAEDLYREAVDRLGRSGLRVEQARVRLLYGEWLRRQRRRRDARDQLRAAYRIFVSAGAGAFAERARTELRATGERAPKRTAQTRETLTARERTYRPAGRLERLQPRDRRAAVHQPGHRRLPPAESLHHARHQLP